MPHISIIVGHTKDQPGADLIRPGMPNLSEYDYNSQLAKTIQEYSQMVQSLTVSVHKRDGIGIDGAYAEALATQPDAIIELHFNSFNGEAHGTETLYNDSKDEMGIREKELAQTVQDFMVKAMDTKDRGLKLIASDDERGFHSLSRTYAVPSILTEPFFGDFLEDAEKAIKRRDALAVAIVDAFFSWHKA